MRAVFAVALLLVAGAVQAGDSDTAGDADAAALSLQGSAPQAAAQPRAWQLFVEGGTGYSEVRDDSLTNQTSSLQRLSGDLRIDATPLSGLRTVFSDRLDYADWPFELEPKREINTIKEAYFSLQPSNNFIFDAGRINEYSGVAIGYNPTDFFRGGAVRSFVSLDPISIKDNRQGSVMVRGQTLWNGGSLTALFSPKLSSQPNSGSFNPDWGATNNVNRGMLIFSKRITEDLNPQFLLYQEEGSSPQIGMNITKLVNNSTVAYVEWSGGRSDTLLTEQEMPTRHAFMFYAKWQDVLINHLDLSALVRYSVADHSNLSWIESRYHWAHDEVALQWLNNSGTLFSEFGASPLRSALELSYRHYF